MQTTPQLNDRDHSVSRPVPQTKELRSNVELVHHLLGGRTLAWDALPSVIYWAVAGLLYGYPLCCVQDFVARATGKRDVHTDPRPLHGTGFKPCAHCAAEFASEPEALVAIITAQRHELLPAFPESNADWQLKMAYDHVLKNRPRS